MKIAYVISEDYAVYSFNGVRIQAQTWADELIRKGHDVVCVNPWEEQKWKEYDVVHIFGPVQFIRSFTKSLMTVNTEQIIVYSPIIDTNQAIWKYKMVSLMGCDSLRLYTHQYNVRKSRDFIKQWFVRSNYEASYVNKAYGIPLSFITVVPLSYRIPTIETYPNKEQFCLHVSSMCEGRKNVMRLMKAAIKYDFKLVIAGTNTPDKFGPFKKVIDANDNIEYLGKVSDKELIELYKKAKVFALPSLYEGVGMVAVEAAAYGDDIVITNLGGPKEYYSDMAFQVDPYKVDEIGRSVIEAMDSKNRQPALMEYIKKNYNISSCVDLLIKGYEKARNIL